MNKTNNFLQSLSKINKFFLKTKNKKEHNLNVFYIIEHNKAIAPILNISENDKSFLCTKMMSLFNSSWVSIVDSLEDINELIDDELNNKQKAK